MVHAALLSLQLIFVLICPQNIIWLSNQDAKCSLCLGKPVFKRWLGTTGQHGFNDLEMSIIKSGYGK